MYGKAQVRDDQKNMGSGKAQVRDDQNNMGSGKAQVRDDQKNMVLVVTCGIIVSFLIIIAEIILLVKAHRPRKNEGKPTNAFLCKKFMLFIKSQVVLFSDNHFIT